MQAYDSFALGLVLLGVVHLGDRYGLQLLRFICSRRQFGNENTNKYYY